MATIFIGLGGSGIETVLKIKDIYDNFEFTRIAGKSEVIFAGIDIDSPKSRVKQGIQFIPIEEPRPRQVIDNHLKDDPDFKRWWKAGYYPELPLVDGNGAGRYRLNGRLVFWQNYDSLRKKIDGLIAEAANFDLGKVVEGGKSTHSIFLINSIAGGTGAGLFIDVGFLIRDILVSNQKADFRLYSLLYEGSIWEAAGIPDAKKVSLGALTQLERWMEKPEDFSVKFYSKKLPTEKPFTQFFDMVYLIDRYNVDNKQFISAGSKNIMEQYIDFGSWVIFTLTMPSAFLQNIIAEFSKLNDKSKTERARRYGSASVSVITVPYEEISDWLQGAFMTEIMWKQRGLLKADPAEIIKDLGIYEEDAGQLSQELKRTNAFSDMMNYFNTVKSNIQASDSKDLFNSNVSNYHLRELSTINEEFIKWATIIDRKCVELNAKFIEKMEENIIKMLKETLDFEGVRLYLTELGNKIEMQKVRAEKSYTIKKSSSVISESMKKILEEIDAVKGLFSKRKMKGLIDEWIALSGFHNYNISNTYVNARISEILLEKLKHFYNSLKLHVAAKNRLLETMAGSSERFAKYYNNIQTAYHDDKSNILDADKLRKQEFPLLINVPISRRDLLSTKDALLQDSRLIESLKDSLWNGMNTTDEELTGFNTLYKQLSQDISETGGKNKEYIQSNGIENLKKIARHQLALDFKDHINKSFRVDVALKNHFSNKYDEYNRLSGRTEEVEAFLTSLKYQVGSDTVESLTAKKLERKDFVETAITGLIKNISRMINPFWSFKNRDHFENEFFEEELNRYNTKGSNPIIYMNEDLDIDLGKLKDFNQNLAGDQFRIFILSYSSGCPLFLLNCTVGADHLLYNEKQKSDRVFNDQRFYDEWKDNIEHESRFEFNDFLFVMSIAFRLVERQQKGKAKGKTYYYGKTNLGSITDAMNKISREYKKIFTEELKIKLREEIFIPRTGEQEIVNKYKMLLSNVEAELKIVEPPKAKGNVTAHNIWKHLYDKVKVERDKDNNVLNYIGSFYKDTQEDIGILVKEHTGLKLI